MSEPQENNTLDMEAIKLGSEINADDVVETLTFLDDWEDRYRYIIDLGKQLPAFPADMQTESRLVRGCQSQVWLETRYDPDADRLQLAVDSDALIVRGLAAIVLAALNGKSPRDVVNYDMEGYFGQIDLLRHLSPIRGNGLRAMVQRIRDTAAVYVSAGE